MIDRDKVYILSIQDSIKSIYDYTAGLNRKDFLSQPIVQDAVIRNLEIIGEAAKNITESIRSEYNDIPWKKMAGMRDVLIHNYLGVDIDIVWNTVQDILPVIEKKISDIIQTM